MRKINSFVKSLFEEIVIFFTNSDYRDTMKKEFFYSIFYHWTALKISIRSQLNIRYLLAAVVIFLIFIGLEWGLQPYQESIVQYISSYLNPVLDSTDQTIDSVKVEDTGKGFSLFTLFSVGISVFISSLKGYYRSLFSEETIGYIFSFEMYKYIVITLARPLLSDLVERVKNQFISPEERILKTKTSIWENYKRAFALSFYSLGMQVILTVLLFPFAPFSSFLVSWYFTGVMLMDNYTRSKGLDAVESHKAIWGHKWYAIGTGMTFNLINFIPFIGPVIAPILSSVASGIGLHEIEKEAKSNAQGATEKEQAYYAAEKQAIEFSKDFNTGIDINHAFRFRKENSEKLKNGTFLNLLAVISIWVTIFYFLFNSAKTSTLLAFLFPLYKPESDHTGEMAAVLSVFNSITYFFSVFFVLFLVGFVFYRFLIFLIQTQNIHSNSLTVQKAYAPESPVIPINRVRLLINSFIVLALELFLIWAALYLFLISSGYSLLLCLGIFLIIDAALIGFLIISSKESFTGLSLSQKTDVLWQHKGFVFATGIVYLAGSYVPFAALSHTPTLAITTAEIGMQKIKLGQTIEYVKQKNNISNLKNG